MGSGPNLLSSLLGSPSPLCDQLGQVRRDVHRLARVDQRPLDRLLDPPRCVRAEPHARVGVEVLNRPHQAEVALGDQVRQRHPGVRVFLGDLDHQPQVRLDHLFPGDRVAVLPDPSGKLLFLLCRQQRGGFDVVEIPIQSGS